MSRLQCMAPGRIAPKPVPPGTIPPGHFAQNFERDCSLQRSGTIRSKTNLRVDCYFHNIYVQGVNKVRRHCSITYNFRINVHSILNLYRHTNRFNSKVRTLLPLLQLYFI